MYDIIADKRDGKILEEAQIAYAVQGYTTGTIPDYQMAALLMAVYLRGMNPAETAQLTAHMAQSGDVVDLSPIAGVKVDKHSTGGVGDKTTLVCAPLAAACGLKIAKMSGRGLGHTGGTVDKMEAIPGMRTALDRQAFFDQVNAIGIAVVGQSGNLAPADKKIYALRDVTATVASIPLIASSIMSKKLAAGADAILLDVKVGGGAFMKTLDEAVLLAKAMVDIGEANGRRTAALLTDMDTPLGWGIGNSIEVAEAVMTLRGEGPSDLTDVSLRLAAGLLQLGGLGSYGECLKQAQKALEDGSGLAKLRAMVQAQGGDAAVIDDPARLKKAALRHRVCAPRPGFITHMDTERVGVASLLLGAGRQTKEDAIDYAAGIILKVKTGSRVQQGEVLAELYTADAEKAQQGEAQLLAALEIGDAPPAATPLVLARVGSEGVEYY